MSNYTNLVGGSWVGAANGDTQDRHNPADRSELVATYPAMSAPDVRRALDAAAAASSAWNALGPIGRGRIMLDAADVLRGDADAIAADICRENGKTLAEADGEVAAAAAFMEYFGGLGRGHWGNRLADRRPDVETFTRTEPLGVVVLITPWNDPLVTPARKLGPALIAGNTVVLKPANETPLSAYHLAHALDRAGLPPGVLNVVTGPSSAVAPALLADRRVRAVSFTGSTAVGLSLSGTLAGTTTRLQTEMGGKNASFVRADADLDLAVETIVSASCGQTGQRCTATSRILVERPVVADMSERLEARLSTLRVGPGSVEGVEVGPLVSESHLDSVLDAVARARDEGANIVGGTRLDDGELSRGNFVTPSLITEVDLAGSTWQDEIFGPVLALAPVDDLQAGIEAVNANRYGLSASIFTRDLASAYRFVREVETGQVAVNLPTSGWDVHVPFGGFKDSGSAFKEHGPEGLAFYTRVKSAAIGFA